MAILGVEGGLIPGPGEGVAITQERKNSEARIRANNKYNNRVYDRINIAVPKGRKAEIQAHAAARGESINGFVTRAIEGQIAADLKGGDGA